jgi:tRNA G18 (ribose-2'-O)-methylase SpoU
MKNKAVVILYNIRSAHNVGSIFRTADGAGVKKIYLTGYTPVPIDRFGRVHAEISKTSLGATESVPWEAVDDPYDLIDRLRAEGVFIIAVEQTPTAIDFHTLTPESDVAYIFGNEIDGVPEEVCTVADAVIYIPMHGTKESLNVSVSAGIILFAHNTQ